MSFFSTVMQVVMREANYSYAAIALLQVMKLPWVLKFLWAPMVDRHCRGLAEYKRTILSAELLYAALILLIGFLNMDAHFYWIVSLVIVSLVASGTQDIATDAMAVLTFSKKDKSLLNSMQSMGSFGGTLVGSGLLLFIFNRFGWNTVIPFVAAFVVLAILPLWFNRGLKLHSKGTHQRVRLTDFVWFFTQKGIGKQVGFLLLYNAGIMGLLSIIRPYLVDLGYTIEEIGLLSGIVGTAAAFVCSFLGGMLVRRIGCHKGRILFALTTLFTATYFLLLTFFSPQTLYIAIGITLLWSSYGLASIVVYTTAMESVRAGREGTDFTVQIVITHIGGMIVAVLSGTIADQTNYTGLFAFQFALTLLSLLYVLCAFRKEKKD